jgi:beta-lactamase superfamily II metal-dependent hydrolase
MKIKIKVLNLGDADCTMVLLENEQSKYLMIIDSGKKSHSEIIHEKINLFMETESINRIDAVILTHYDDDHIGGMLKLFNYFQAKINTLYAMGISETLNIPTKNKRIEYEGFLPADDDDSIGSSTNFCKNKNLDLLIRTIEQEKELIKEVNKTKISIKKPIANSLNIEGFPEIQILGPSEEYLTSLYPKISQLEDFFEGESILQSYEGESSRFEDPFEHLDSIKKSNVTKENLVSVILMITINGRKFLFPGDAGIKSFLVLPNYEEQLKDLFWLKVPHHGSINNINSELIKQFSPKHAAISGKKYYSEVVASCFNAIGSDVKVTSLENEDLYYEFNF